jgi:hypothetical protein
MAPTDPLAPTVEITSPDAIDDPDDGALVETEVEVVCEVTQSTEDGAEPVLPESVSISMHAEDGTTLVDNSGHETTPGVFTSTFSLVTLPDGTPVDSGKVSFHCSASDSADPPHAAEDEISTFIDHGPIITVTRPEPDSAYSPEGSVPFDFEVAPDELVDGDTGAEVDGVTLEVAGMPIDLIEDPDGRFHASVNLKDPDFPPLTTIAVQIQATNSRNPEPAVASLKYFIKVDSEGPTIEVAEPADKQIVGGEVRVRFTVTDALSRVDKGTVSVTINDEPPVPYEDNGSWTNTDNEFIYRFDTTEIEDSISQASINIDAKDEAGNASPGATLVVHLDNQPPILDLDPPLIREFDGAGPWCSVAFDPVGSYVPNDLDDVLTAERFRVLVWEDTNKAPGQRILFSSPTDKQSVHIYLRDRPSRTRPLLIDTDKDGVCDNIATTGLTDEKLTALDKDGASFFGSALNDPMGAPALPQGSNGQPYCDYKNLDMIPTRLCGDTSDMIRVIEDDAFGHHPSIYALSPVDVGDDPTCTGIDWSIGSFAEEGWVCVAAVAKDGVPNVGVSPPLRLCLDKPGGANPPNCPMPPPDCTDGCSLRPTPALDNPWDPSWTFEPQ